MFNILIFISVSVCSYFLLKTTIFKKTSKIISLGLPVLIGLLAVALFILLIIH